MHKKIYCIAQETLLKYPVINYNGKESGKEYIYVHIYAHICKCMAESLCCTSEAKTIV